MKKNLILLVCCLLMVTLIVPIAGAKRKKKKEQKTTSTPVEQRIENLSKEDKRLFNALSKEQQKAIQEGRIEKGFNEWMAELALGKPYYATEHHPVYTDYEQVWLYTKPEVKEKIDEEHIIDRITNWPTVHRKIRRQTCVIGDFFILWDRGVVETIEKAKERKVHGTCIIETKEAFLPIVDGKPVEPK